MVIVNASGSEDRRFESSRGLRIKVTERCNAVLCNLKCIVVILCILGKQITYFNMNSISHLFSSRKTVFYERRQPRDGGHPPEAGHELRSTVERPRKPSGGWGVCTSVSECPEVSFSTEARRKLYCRCQLS
jgi:hypothetical protein